MIITEPKKLSLPQQVEKNRLDIKELLAVATLLSSIIELGNLSHVLTTEELALANKPVSFIVYNNEIYAKSWKDNSYIYFLTTVKIDIQTTTVFSYKQIKASISSGQLAQETKSFSTYGAAVLDLALAQKANLSGADFTGEIKAPSIIQTMEGFSYVKTSGLSEGVSPVYVGMSQTGNKLTIVMSLIINAAQLQNAQPRFGRLLIPKSIGDKIFELPNDQWGTVSGSTVPLYTLGSYSSPAYQIGVIGSIQHEYDSEHAQLLFGVNSFQSPTIDMTKSYFLRFEITFLLSENLTQ